MSNKTPFTWPLVGASVGLGIALVVIFVAATMEARFQNLSWSISREHAPTILHLATHGLLAENEEEKLLMLLARDQRALGDFDGAMQTLKLVNTPKAREEIAITLFSPSGSNRTDRVFSAKSRSGDPAIRQLLGEAG